MAHVTRGIAPLRRPARMLAALALLLVAGTARVQAQEVTDTTKLPAAMRSARAGLNKALEAKDGVAAGAFFADSVVVDFQGDLYTGRRTAVDTWLVPTLSSVSSLRFSAGTFMMENGDIIERAVHHVVPADGSGDTQEGTHIVRWKHMPDGSWKVIRLTVSEG